MVDLGDLQQLVKEQFDSIQHILNEISYCNCDLIEIEVKETYLFMINLVELVSIHEHNKRKQVRMLMND
jgi:hypothetical protein